jgi:hypothetical protein
MMRFPKVYSAQENWEFGLKVALTKAAEDKKLQAHSPKKSQCHRKEGRWLDIHDWLRPKIYQNRETTDIFKSSEDVFEKGHKTTCMKRSRAKDYRGSLGKTLPRKTTTILPVDKEDRCPFSINVYYCATGGHHYLSSKGFVRNFLDGVHCSHLHQEKLTVLFSSRNDIDML